MRFPPRPFISLLVIAGLLSGVVLVAPPASAASSVTWTSTADFDAGTKPEPSVAKNWFAENGVQGVLGILSHPSSFFSVDRTYVTWLGPDSSGSVFNDSPWITYYNHTTGAWASPVKIADCVLSGAACDDHSNPAILVTSDGFLHVFYKNHVTPQRYARSTNARDISA